MACMVGHHIVQPDQVLGLQLLQFHHFGVDPGRVQAEHKGDTTGHAGSQVAPGLTQDHHPTAGHVLTRVVSDSLDDGQGPGITGAEALTDPSPQESLTRGGAIEQGVAGDDIVLRQEQHIVWWPHDHPAAGKSLAHIVIGITDQIQRDSGRQERSDRLAGRPGQGDVDGVVGQSGGTVAAGDLRSEQGAHRSVDVADG